jgi:hypothetical protein
MVDGQWKDVNVYNQKSISDFEEFFNEDLNSDGRVGVNAAALTLALLDTQGARLARNTNDNSLYIVEGVGEAAKAKSIRTNGGDLEYKNTWGTAGSILAVTHVKLWRWRRSKTAQARSRVTVWL